MFSQEMLVQEVLADGLDLDYRRADLEQLKRMALAPEEALDWWLHHYVSGVQVSDEYVRIGYRVPRDCPAYEGQIPPLVEQRVRADFEALRDVLRLYGVKVDIAPPSAVRPMRAVRSMPEAVWAAAQRRLAGLAGEGPATPALSPLVDTVRGLLETMGYRCALPEEGADALACFRCQPAGGGLREPIVVGCKDGPAEVTDVRALVARLGEACPKGYLVAETRVLSSALIDFGV